MMRTLCQWLLVALLVTGHAPVRAQSIFDGDRIDQLSGRPYTILPGAPLLLPGLDDKFGTSDDVIDLTTVGDVDLVLRTGGTFGGGTIPPPAAGVGSAPAVVAGGLDTGQGSEVQFQVIVSDGATTSLTGNALLNGGMDNRGVLVLAYADLDDDGVIGPTNADGSADNQIELQEIQRPAGRQVGLITGGVANGSLGVALGAPASAGGLAVILVAGATAGPTPPLYDDGPWVATLLPFMLSPDPQRIIGRGNVLPPDPEGLVEVRLEPEKLYAPIGHPLLGTPFALPTDGSSPTIDIARAVAAGAVSAAFVQPITLATFVAASTRRVLPSVDAGGARWLLESMTTMSLPDDGPGNGASFLVQVTDLLGNPADPGPSGFAMTLETGSSLRIVNPDTDGDPHREDLVLNQAAPMAVAIDDDGGAGDGAATDQVLLTAGGAPAAALHVTLIGGGINPTATSTPIPTHTSTATPPSTPQRIGDARVRMHARSAPSADQLTVDVTAPAAGFAPSLHAVRVILTGANGTIYDRSFPAGAFVAKRGGKVFAFQDAAAVTSARVVSAKLKPTRRDPSQLHLLVKVVALDLPAVNASDVILAQLEPGASTSAATLTCSAKRQGEVLICAP